MNPPRFRRFTQSLVGTLFFFVSICLVDGAVFSVADGDAVGLKNAINAANSNGEDDTIELAANGNYVLDTIDNDVNGLPVIAADGGRKLIIHGNGAVIERSTLAGTPVFRILELGVGSDLEITRLTISNGQAWLSDDGNGPYPEDYGGGIRLEGASLVLTNCVISGNSAKYGGGVAVKGQYGDANVTLNNTTIINNRASSGAGVFNTAYRGPGPEPDSTPVMRTSKISMDGSQIIGNAADYSGGGIASYGGDGHAEIIINNSLLSGNSAVSTDGENDGAGGAIANSSTFSGDTGYANLAITNSTISNNSSNNGGGIDSRAGAGFLDRDDSGNVQVVIVSSTINGNSAQLGSGGAVSSGASAGSALLTITNTTIANNSADNYGGAVENGAGAYAFASASMLNDTVSGNVAAFGSCFANFENDAVPPQGTFTIGNTILSAPSSTETIYSNCADYNACNFGAISSIGENIATDEGDGFLIASGDQINTDPKLDPAGLMNNGGPTQTIGLLANSPAINAGDDSHAPVHDQRYYLRNGRSDVGAFEYGGTIAPMTAVSRKTHGGAGEFDVDLPLTGTAGIECRSGGGTNDYKLVLTFATPVSINGSPQAQVTTGAGQIGSGGTANSGNVNIDSTATVVTVPLTNISNAQQIAVTLFGVSDGTNSTNVVIPMSILIGDTNTDTFVDAIDAAQTKSKSGQAINSTNFREDVNADGFLDAIDVAFVKSKSGTTLPGTSAAPLDQPPPASRARRSREGSSLESRNLSGTHD